MRRNVFILSAGVCALCAALAPAQALRADEAPSRRGLLPADEKQSVNKLAPRDDLRALNERPAVRTFLSEPSGLPVSDEKAAKYATGVFDIRTLSRDLADSAQTRHLSFLRPVPGEKGNVLPESAEMRHMTAPSEHRFLPAEQPVRPSNFALPSERR